MAAHYSILAWRIPWTEEPGGLQSIGSQRDGHNLATKQQQISLVTSKARVRASEPLKALAVRNTLLSVCLALAFSPARRPSCAVRLSPSPLTLWPCKQARTLRRRRCGPRAGAWCPACVLERSLP